MRWVQDINVHWYKYGVKVFCCFLEKKRYRENTINYLMSSSAVASARKRRAGITQTNPLETPQTSNNSGQQQQGLTLPQVINVIDTRLTKLEKFMNDTKEQRETYSNPMIQQSQIQTIPNVEQSTISNLSEIIDEFQQRFLLLAEEINSLKDTIIKLQSYTMDVNKTLMEERINILSDLGENNNGMFVFQQDETLLEENNNNMTSLSEDDVNFDANV
jgi:enamine deaminase RidA (YjgF/YER057c/UK114 family)